VLVGIVSLDIWMYRFFTGTPAVGEAGPDTS